MKGGTSKYDDTDLLSRMFQKDNKVGNDPIIEPTLGLNRCESSSEVLHKSQSQKMLGDVPPHHSTSIKVPTTTNSVAALP